MIGERVLTIINDFGNMQCVATGQVVSMPEIKLFVYCLVPIMTRKNPSGVYI